MAMTDGTKMLSIDGVALMAVLDSSADLAGMVESYLAGHSDKAELQASLDRFRSLTRSQRAGVEVR